MKKKILISSGGSGGHIFPACTFYDHLKEDFEVFLTLDERGSKFIDEKKYKFKIISAPRIELNFIKLPFIIINLIISIFKSFFFLKNNKINILIGTGGYMSIPICLAGKILNIKIYLFEPNMVIGRTNKFLLRFSEKIFCYSSEIINFPNKQRSKIVVIEHILRKEIYNYKDKFNQDVEKKIKLLVVGGSQGAEFFDEQLKNSIYELSKKYKLMVYHQLSSSDFSSLQIFYKEKNIENKLFNFEENIFEYIAEANLAITRAGASTLSELSYLNVPFIAIPYKFATDNHQLQNALYYKKNGCCWILNEKEINQTNLTQILFDIIEDKEDYLIKKKKLENFSYKNTWNNINQKLLESIK